MNLILSSVLIVPILFVIKTLCEPFPFNPRLIKDSCINLVKLRQFLENKWTKTKSIFNKGFDIPSKRPIKKTSKFPTPIKLTKSTVNNGNQRNNYTVKSKLIDGHPWLRGVAVFDVSYFVGIHFEESYFSKPLCGGVMIDRSTLLTSESCITRNMFTHLSPKGFIRMPLVVANSDRKALMGDKPFSRIVLLCKLTDKYAHEWSDVLVAWIRPQNDYLISYASLSSPSVDPIWRAAVGFGQTDFNDNKDEPNSEVTVHWIRIAKRERCALLLTKRAGFDNHFCTKGGGYWYDKERKAKGHGCSNDAGGPIFGYERQSRYSHALHGIISNLDYERPCLTLHHWRLYSRIDRYVPKIMDLKRALRYLNNLD